MFLSSESQNCKYWRTINCSFVLWTNIGRNQKFDWNFYVFGYLSHCWKNGTMWYWNRKRSIQLFVQSWWPNTVPLRMRKQKQSIWTNHNIQAQKTRKENRKMLLIKINMQLSNIRMTMNEFVVRPWFLFVKSKIQCDENSCLFISVRINLQTAYLLYPIAKRELKDLINTYFNLFFFKRVGFKRVELYVLIDKHFWFILCTICNQITNILYLYLYSFRENSFNMCPIELLRNRENPLTR